jgi:hypothetical protein
VKRRKSSTIRRIRRDKSLFSAAKANTFEKFFITSIITGFATGMEIVIGTWFVKAFMQTVDAKTGILPTALRNVVHKE